MSIASNLKLNFKNALPGARTNRRIVVFDIDDYGNVRLHSKQARNNLEKAGLNARSRFDEVDAMETNDDFDALFEVLRKVKDKHGNPAKFTAYALPANINFEEMIESKFRSYTYELLPETLNKLGHNHCKVMDYWRQGIREGLIQPEFHGREHLHVKTIMEKLKRGDRDVLTCFENRSLARISSGPFRHVSWNCAFDFELFDENRELSLIIDDGLKAFQRVFDLKPTVFCAPGASSHHVLLEAASRREIKYVESQLIQREHQGAGKTRTVLNYTGKRTTHNVRHIVRNCVFEPNDPTFSDWVGFGLAQIEAAFRWRKPAVISSHRVNFCGHIDETNRKNGLSQLNELLVQIVRRWPDVEFMSTAEMAEAVGI